MRDYEIGRAEGCLANLREQGRAITPEQEKVCLEYSTDVLGDDRYASWFKVFTAVQSEFKEGWIPPNYYENIVIPKLKSSYGFVGNMNALVGRIFPELTGPEGVFPNIAYFAGGRFFTHLMEPISDSALFSLLFDGRDRVVYKLDGSFGGFGVHFINREDFDPARIRQMGMGVFQTVIKQHRTLEDFHPTSVATLRINTVVTPDGLVKMPVAMMRIGTGNTTHVQTASNIRVAIDDAGCLLKTASKAGFRLVTEHPDTKRSFEGFPVPEFHAAVGMCIELQKRLRFICSIGWDLAIDSDKQVRIMEYNTRHNGFVYAEALTGPHFTGLGWENLWRD